MKIICFFIFVFLFLNNISGQQILSDTSLKTYEENIPGTEMKFKMVAIPAGCFKMGSEQSTASKDEGPQRKINLSGFWMGAYEVTYDEYDAFFSDESLPQNSKIDAVTRPSPPYIDLTQGMGKSGGYPANSMQQYGALMYCRWLYRKTGIFFRLPTEAEWEYACRAGVEKTDPAILDESSWYVKNSEGQYHKVGQLKPNAWGLFDMLGNVAEWTLDQYDENYFQKLSDGVTDPVVTPLSRHPRTVRGGTYKDEANELRCSNRLQSDAVWNRRDPQIPKSFWWNADAPFVGFRIVRPLKQPSATEAEDFFKLYLGQ